MDAPSPQALPRVLVVGPLPPPEGGIANQTRQLLRLLDADGAAAGSVNTQPPYRPRWMGRVRGLRALARLVPFLFSLWRACGRADVVHVMANSGWTWHLHAAMAVRIARLRKRPVIVNYRGGLAAEFLARSARQVIPVLRRAMLVVPSRFLQQVFDGHGIRARIIPNIVDLERFHSAATERAPAAHLVVVRSLEPIYGNDLAVRAVALLRPRHAAVRLSIAGDGVERPALESLARELGVADCVRFMGRITPDAVADLMRDADIVVNPVRVDNMPNSVIEALACGVPVVSTRVGGIPWLIEHERTGWLVDPESPSALAAGITRVLEDAPLRARLTAAGLLHARSFSWPAIRAQWFDAYRHAAGWN